MYISKEVKKALTMFDLDFPFTEIDLKKKFRVLIMKHHPDVEHEDNSEIMTRSILSNYEKLKSYMTSKIDLEIPEHLLEQWHLEDQDITNIYDPCPTCNGTKYEKHIISVRVGCPDCDGHGAVKLKCKYCTDGIYTTKRNYKIPCKACGGTGVWKEVPCRSCNPRSFGYRKRSRMWTMFGSLFDIGYAYEDRMVNRVCSNCHGRGKVKLELYNPVIKRGSILKG